MLVDKIGDKYIVQITDVSLDKQKTDASVIVQGLFKVDYLASVNTMYIINDSRKILDPNLKEQRRKIWYQFDCMGYDRNCIPEDCKLTFEMMVYMNHYINGRDTDNTIKFLQDTIAEYFNFNDARIYNLSVAKRPIINSDKELVHFRIKKFYYNDKEQKIDNRLLI